MARVKVNERLREELSRGCEYSGTQEVVQAWRETGTRSK